MFDINEQIIKWRSNLTKSETLGSSDIEELESHLHEEIEQLKTLKLSDEEAFLIAAHRLGTTDSLAAEYEKINRGSIFRRRLSLMITGILTYLLATHFTTAVSKGCVLLAANSGITGHRSLGFIGFGSQILILMTTFFLGYFICRLIIQRPGFKKQTKQLTTRMRLLKVLLIFLIMTDVTLWLMSPVPGFRPGIISIQVDIAQALTYTKFLWSIFLPIILVMLLINLRKPNSQGVKSK
jgi:hypothetical protein